MNRRTKKLWSWMISNDVTVKEIAAANKVSLSAVYQYLRGEMASTNLRTWFLGRRCPANNLPPVSKPAPKKTATIGKAA